LPGDAEECIVGAVDLVLGPSLEKSPNHFSCEHILGSVKAGHLPRISVNNAIVTDTSLFEKESVYLSFRIAYSIEKPGFNLQL
jgi:hypothetical protein